MLRAFRPPSVRLLLACSVAVLSWPAHSRAQMGAGRDDFHVCDDCHGSHDAGRGNSALVRRGWSAVAPQAPGLSGGSERCLQCHGTAGDRQQVELATRAPLGEPIYLGGSLLDDHPLGSVWAADGVSVSVPRDRAGFGQFGIPSDPGAEPGVSVECVSCHDPHAPSGILAQTERQDDVCVSCHDPSLDYTTHGLASCGTCHRQHGAAETEHFLRERSPNDLCGACHRGAAPPLNDGIEEIPGSPLHAEPSDPDCTACHTIH